MSGGEFNYRQYVLLDIAERIEHFVTTNDSNEVNDYEETIGRHYNEKTIKYFKKTIELLKKAHKRVHKIDYLLSGDTEEDSLC